MKEITREEMMTSPGEWNPSLLDDAPNVSEKRLRQYTSTPMGAIDVFYNMKGDIVVQKNNVDTDEIFIVSDASSTSSGSRRRSYCSRTRKEKQKKRHSSKGERVKSIKWWDGKKS